MVPNSKNPTSDSSSNQHPPNRLIFWGLVSFAWFFHWSATQTPMDRPLPFATGSFPPVSWKNRWFPSKVLIYTWVTISWYQDLPFQAIPSFIWRGNLGQKPRVTTVTSLSDHWWCLFFFLRFWIVWSGMHGIMVGKKEIAFQTTWSEDDVCFGQDISPLWATRRWPTCLFW